MTQSPQSEPKPVPSNRRLWLLLLRRGSFALGVVLLAGVATGSWWAWNFINKDLVPLVQTNLQQLLGRPVELGKVEGVTFTGLRFNSLLVPATATDPDKVVAKAVDVQYSVLEVLFTRTLKLNVTLVQPNVYVEQDKDGRWISTTIKTQAKGTGVFKTELDTVRVSNGNVVLVPFPKSNGSVTLDQVGATAQILPNNQGITFSADTLPSDGGKVKIAGKTEFNSQKTSLNVQTENFVATNLTKLVKVPLSVQAGTVDANLAVDLQQQNEPKITINGTANLNQITAQVNNIPQKLNNIQGRLNFQGQEIAFDNVNTSYGKIPLQVNGTLNTQAGINLSGQVKPVALATILSTINASLPVQATGLVQANFKVQGTVQQPTVTGSFNTIKTAQVDRFQFNNISSNFRVNTSGTAPNIIPNITIANFQATPTVGGKVTGGGEVKLGKAGQLNVNLQLADLPGNTVAQAYNFALPVDVGTVSANANITGQLGSQPLQLALESLKIAPKIGGQIGGSGNIQLAQQGRVNLNFQAANIPGNTVAQAYNVSLPVDVGNISANANVTGQLGSQPLQLALQSLKIAPKIGGQIAGSGNIQLAQQGRVNLNFQAANIPGNTVAQAYNVSLPIDVGNISANANVTGQLGTQSLQLALQSLRIAPKIGGEIAGSGNIQLAQQGRVNLNLLAANIPGDAVAKAYKISLPQIKLGNVLANAKISGSLNNIRTVAQLQLPNATYPGSGEVVITNAKNIEFQDVAFKVAGGTVAARGKLVDNRWQAFVDANRIQLSQVQQIPAQFRKYGQNGLFQISSKLNLSGTTASFQPEAIQATGQARLNVADGTVNLRDISLNNGRWQTLADVSQVALNRFSENLRGRLSSNLLIAGTTKSSSLADIRAAGEVGVSQVAVIDQPVTAKFEYNGQQIIVKAANTPGFSANGTIAVNFQQNTPQVGALNLNVRARGYNLAKTPFTLPANLAVAGRVDFNGQVTGTLNSPNAAGNLQLQNFAVNQLAFDPVLSGNVNFQGGKGGQLDLAGSNQDRIAVTVGANYRPTSFLIRRDQSIASGRTEGENLFVNVKDFPIAVARNLIPADNINLQPIAGNISGDLAVNLDKLTGSGDIALAQPRIGRVNAESFQGRLNFGNGIATLINGELQVGQSRIALNGNVKAGNNPEFQVTANVDQAKIEKLLQAFSIYGFQDFSSGLQPPSLAGAEALLQTKPAELTDNRSLLTQLQEFSEITAPTTQPEIQQQTPTLPGLEELKGLLSGKIDVSGSLRSGINANFDFTGSTWDWGQYNINEVIAKGSFTDGILTLLPLRVGLNDGFFGFSGQLGKEASGQLRASNLPISLLQPFLNQLPVDVTGKINAFATVAGNLNNPQAIGEASLADATVNEKAVQTAQLSFNYNNARLNFNSIVLATGTQPANITGNIPIALPFASVKPESNQIQISANVQNEGLSLLNLLTDQVNWIKGEGKVDVDIAGTFNQPLITGNVTINNATFQAQALPQPLTDVTGTLQFNRDILNVENLQGQYNQGQLTAAGILPIFAPQQGINNPLTLSLNQLTLNVQELYQGGVDGTVVIKGTALNPEIGGEIQLANGQVSLAEQTSQPSQQKDDGINTQINSNINEINNTSTIPNNTPITENKTTARPPIKLAGLQLILGDNISVVRQPLLNFQAKGDLTVNGTLAKPVPEGVIRLTGGRVNLFTTQFVLDRGYEQTATFIPSQGLDPTLDVRLTAIVPEVGNTRQPISPLSSEISEVPASSFGTVRSVRVQARANGPASKLQDNLELTSDPRRSQPEIVSLIGGTFVNAFNQGGGLGLISSAGSSLLSPVQGAISALGESIGLRELRLYPTVVTNQKSVSVLGLAGEAAFDINRNFSLSLSRVFVGDEPFRYNLLYRVNDEVLVRGSSDLSGDSRALVEYESRF
jgi:translocation and assembly module TamB